MGILRIYLAACVVAAHSERVFPWSAHGGREAVEIFFVISGFYMQLILSLGKYRSASKFFYSRFQRIFLPYYCCLCFCVCLSLSWWLLFKNALSCQTIVSMMQAGMLTECGNLAILGTNLTILGQDSVMFLDRTHEGQFYLTPGVEHCITKLYNLLIIPQTWSVAIELQFYLLSPFLANRLNTRSLIIIAFILAIMRCNCITLFGIDYDPWNYRFAPFELFNFLVGMISCRIIWLDPIRRQNVEKFCSRMFPYATILSYILFILLCFLVFRLLLGSQSFTYRILNPISLLAKEVAALGIIVLWGSLLPFLFCVTRSNSVDRFIGELSYPIYLLHLTVALAVQDTVAFFDFSDLYSGQICFALTTVIAIGLQFGPLRYLESRRQLSVQSSTN